ncbi:septal ring lytic transglycosylase RlpA family protein [Jiella sp. MQZ9-1]|uniref:Endolytic peptidoglycan transglycosylase RlpA n=1 Tax=Jiella flava TaxID=2816857 RepID=A0A939FY03_9HYPH|nr:septal ring lytic transglycosylase RlpA family protein [Jiella flava]MBO0662821.1 septal ring lytic transglycosylase RlpA family protein [Jiella flava]MCD2471418.1 septal ring lytic transglycosylase RlpA family protein [Jiella flava]
MFAGCSGSGSGSGSPLEQLAELSTTVKFDSKSYGVPASPRVTNLRSVRKGGGRVQIGKPYKVKGKWYYPKEQPGYVKLGKASWYGPNFHGRLTANGEVYDMHGLSAAHKTFPLPSYAMVTNLKNGNTLMVRVNDRGPYADGRVIDLSSEAADLLGFKSAGTADVKVEYVGRAPLEGDDTKMLMASFKPGEGGSSLTPDTVMMAAVQSRPATTAGAGAGIAVANAYGEDLPGVQTPGLPVPTARPASADQNFGTSLFRSSFAEETAGNGAASALTNLAASAPGRAIAAIAPGETIEVGTVDAAMLERVKAVAFGQGALSVETAADAYAAKIAVRPDADTDRLLKRLWEIGAEDAFVLRN